MHLSGNADARYSAELILRQSGNDLRDRLQNFCRFLFRPARRGRNICMMCCVGDTEQSPVFIQQNGCGFRCSEVDSESCFHLLFFQSYIDYYPALV